MAIQTTTTVICDQCGKEEQWPGDWLTLAPLSVARPNAGLYATLALVQPPPPRHFCSYRCARSWIKRREEG